MLEKIRNFSKSIFAKILLVIIIIPFVFWGMGGVFRGGNTNNIVEINNYNISTQDFIDHINNLSINEEIIREKINENILEEILTLFIFASEFVLPLLNTPPIPQNTKGIITITNNILAKKVFENFLILLNMVFFNLLNYKRQTYRL